jgi:hypothetical protein
MSVVKRASGFALVLVGGTILSYGISDVQSLQAQTSGNQCCNRAVEIAAGGPLGLCVARNPSSNIWECVDGGTSPCSKSSGFTGWQPASCGKGNGTCNPLDVTYSTHKWTGSCKFVGLGKLPPWSACTCTTPFGALSGSTVTKDCSATDTTCPPPPG